MGTAYYAGIIYRAAETCSSIHMRYCGVCKSAVTTSIVYLEVILILYHPRDSWTTQCVLPRGVTTNNGRLQGDCVRKLYRCMVCTVYCWTLGRRLCVGQCTWSVEDVLLFVPYSRPHPAACLSFPWGFFGNETLPAPPLWLMM